MRSAILLGVLLGGSQYLAGNVLYAVTDLGNLGYGNTLAYGINNLGQVTGQSGGEAFLYSDGKMTDIGAYGTGYGINDLGQITGQFVSSTSPHDAFLYSNGKIMPLGFRADYSAGQAINNSGQITGVVIGNEVQHGGAFLYSNGQISYLVNNNIFEYGNGTGWGINNLGQVTGEFVPSGNGYESHAFLYRNGQLTDLGTLGGASFGQAVNNLGQVTGGFYSANPGSEAFLYSNGKMTDLGFGYGYGINDEGVVVGSNSSGYLVAYLGGEALLYKNGQSINLDTVIDPALGVHLGAAMAINDAGQIVANSADGKHAYLLTPVPEPGTRLQLGAAGFVAAGILRFRRRMLRFG